MEPNNKPKGFNRREFLQGALKGLAASALTLAGAEAFLVATGRDDFFKVLEDYNANMDSPQNKALELASKNLESKKFHYELHGIQFISNTVSAEALAPYMDEAIKKVGGPYWSPEKPIVIEHNNIGATNCDNYVLIGNSKSYTHELIHLLIGPFTYKWPKVLSEFFAYSANLEKSYTSDELNHPTISMIDPLMISIVKAKENNLRRLMSLRNIAVSQLSNQLSDEQRREMCKAATQKGEINMDELDTFVKQFGIDHAVFKKGKPGELHHAFAGIDAGRRIVDLVSYQTDEYGRERPKLSTIHLIPQDKNGEPITKEEIKVNVSGVSTIIVPELYRHIYRNDPAFNLFSDFTKKEGKITSIYIPEWDLLVDLYKKNKHK